VSSGKVTRKIQAYLSTDYTDAKNLRNLWIP
jgi:hypothetical protein